MPKDSEKYFDLSDFPKDHKCYSDVNKKRLGYFKDETAGVPIVEFVGLRSKMYSISLLEDGSSKNTAKGIQNHFSKTNLKHELYRKCLVEQSINSMPSTTVYAVSTINCILYVRINLL